MFRLFLLCVLSALPHLVAAAECPGNANALGTERVLTVDPAAVPRVGRKQFPTTLPLAPNEIVLTFDDGPWPATTARVLDALKSECVLATFFLVGRNTVANPALARRTLAEGHTVGYHSYSHPRLDQMALARAETDIDRGFAAVDTVLYGAAQSTPVTPFFRFPYFASNKGLLDRLFERKIAVFGADLWAADWIPMTPAEELHQIMQQLAVTKGGILLLHDTHRHTAATVPMLLRELKRRHFRVVHVVPPDRRLADLAKP